MSYIPNQTIYQGTSPWTINGTVSIGAGGSGVTTVYQGGAPWTINGTVSIGAGGSGVTTVYQGGAPWLVQATIGIPTVTATVFGAISVIPTVVTVLQGTNPWLVNASIVGVQNVNASIIGVQNVIATALQGTSPWLVNASIVGTPLAVTATLGQQTVTATYAAPWNLTATIGNTVNTFSLPQTSGGLSVFDNVINATTATVKASGGQIYGWHLFNTNATQIYVQLYNAAAATVGLTNPLLNIGVPANGGAAWNSDIGIAFSTGILISACVSRGGVGAPSNNIDVNIYYD